VEPTDDTTVALLRAQIDRAEASRDEAERALEEEKAARFSEAVELGEMMARLSQVEARARGAEKESDEQRARAQDERRRATDFEGQIAHLQIDLREALSLAEARGEELDAERMRARGREQELSSALTAALEAKSEPKRSVRPPPHDASGETAALREQLEASRAEAHQLRESLDGLRKRAGTIGVGLKEMRELMVESAALFDDLEDRERAIAEVRARSLREARALFLRAAGPGGPPPPLPVPKMPIEDLSDAAELLEEEVRASLRPKPSSMR
jgi:chromosome segregation ATPase